MSEWVSDSENEMEELSYKLSEQFKKLLKTEDIAGLISFINHENTRQWWRGVRHDPDFISDVIQIINSEDDRDHRSIVSLFINSYMGEAFIFPKFKYVIKTHSTRKLSLLIESDRRTQQWWNFIENDPVTEEDDVSLDAHYYADRIIRLIVEYNDTQTIMSMIVVLMNSYIGRSIGTAELFKLLAEEATLTRNFELLYVTIRLVNDIVLVDENGRRVKTIDWTRVFLNIARYKMDNLHMIMLLLPKLRVYWRQEAINVLHDDNVPRADNFSQNIEIALNKLYANGNYKSFRYLFEATADIRDNLDMDEIYDTDFDDMVTHPSNEVLIGRQQILKYLEPVSPVPANMSREDLYPSDLNRTNLIRETIHSILQRHGENRYPERTSPRYQQQEHLPVSHYPFESSLEYLQEEMKSPIQQEERKSPSHQQRLQRRSPIQRQEEKTDSPRKSDEIFKWD
jgi:hypothetical protein